MALGPIPKASIDRHVEGWPDEDGQMFRACIREMEAASREKPVSNENPQAAFDRMFR